ncbi:MAG: MgtC/SapB family protein [Sedimenticola sp.]|nr:MgtC/SapB family protein [Sedimenticola sp.]
MSEEYLAFYNLGVALAIGLLIGVERGWQDRDAGEGARVAGVRTHGLIGLLGGCCALLAESTGPIALGLGFAALAGVLATVYVVNLRYDQDVGITSLMAGLLTFSLGALAVMGELAIAAASAVVTVLLLSQKPRLHGWINALEKRELHAAIKLLLISVVLLPVLPDKGYGPWQALNPYVIWWMVVLIASLSFVGYFAIRIGGTRRGMLFTGLFGGLASSTALTLHFSRLSRINRQLDPVLAVGILFACGTMFGRMLLVSSMLNHRLFELLLLPAALMSLIVYLPAAFYWFRQRDPSSGLGSPLANPLELKTAVLFGLLLALVMLLGRALKAGFGESGLIALAAASGVADVDAITLSLARMSAEDLVPGTAAMGIIVAAAANSLAKAVMATLVGGIRIGLMVGIPLLVAALGGVVFAGFWA